MRLLYLANNPLGLSVAQWLRDREDCQIVGVILNPQQKRSLGEGIAAACGVPEDCVFDGDSLDEDHILERIRLLRPDMGLSVLFGVILTSAFLRLLPRGCVNLHPSYLPFNRGAHPNVWSIVDGTPAGVTLHVIDEGVDTGPIIARREVPVDPTDTGKTLYAKLMRAGEELLREMWPTIDNGNWTPILQRPEDGTYHRVSDFQRLREIPQDRQFAAGELIDRLRAMTFPPHRGAYVVRDGRRVYLELSLAGDAGEKST